MQRAETKTGKRPFMLIDVSLCIGCHACVNACKFENGLSIKQFNTWIETWDAGDYPQVVRANVPHLCNHCDNAPCLAVCPTGATYRNDDGLILVDQDRCIGCKYCMAACPFAVRRQLPHPRPPVRRSERSEQRSGAEGGEGAGREHAARAGHRDEHVLRGPCRDERAAEVIVGAARRSRCGEAAGFGRRGIA